MEGLVSCSWEVESDAKMEPPIQAEYRYGMLLLSLFDINPAVFCMLLLLPLDSSGGVADLRTWGP
jgi:hypothetical protein